MLPPSPNTTRTFIIHTHTHRHTHVDGPNDEWVQIISGAVGTTHNKHNTKQAHKQEHRQAGRKVGGMGALRECIHAHRPSGARHVNNKEDNIAKPQNNQPLTDAFLCGVRCQPALFLPSRTRTQNHVARSMGDECMTRLSVGLPRLEGKGKGGDTQHWTWPVHPFIHHLSDHQLSRAHRQANRQLHEAGDKKTLMMGWDASYRELGNCAGRRCSGVSHQRHGTHQSMNGWMDE
mmetsp:Transcript_17210/g.48877  ORF Transcript_17210/g.48877 Transcript_17210/m.48877 type:complete len:233 (+) Transcript_17210:439-1137(+)